MAAELNLQPAFPGKVGSELKRRSDAVAAKDSAWMYKKYAYINITTTGKTQTAICGTAGYTIGGKPSSLYPADVKDKARRLQPTLTSVTMVNEGGSDYTDSYLYTIEFSFKVFSQADLDAAEAAFFRTGVEVKFNFGWTGTSIVDGVNQNPSDPFLANVYNYSFSMDTDGGFNCTIKCMSPNGLWSKQTMGGTKASADADPDRTHSNFVEGFRDGLRLAFGAAPGANTQDLINDKSDNGALVPATGQTKSGNTSFSAPYWVAEIEKEVGILNDTEQMRSYTNIASVIKYIELLLKAQKATFTYKIADGDAGTYHTAIWGSANPSNIVLPGSQANYGSTMDWSGPSATGNAAALNIGAILVSIEYMDELYTKLSTATTSKKGGKKVAIKIGDFLTELFNEIESLSGGMISILTLPSVTSEGEVKMGTAAAPSKIIVANRRKTITTSPPTPHEFTVLGKGSILKSVSMETDFDAESLMLAGPGAIGTGNSTNASLSNLYTECPELTDANEDAKTDDGGEKITPGHIKTRMEKYGKSGYSSEDVSGNIDLFSRMLTQNIAEGQHANTQFAETIWPLNLNITIDGIFGISFMSPITIDRMPSIYRGNKKVYFSVTSVEHSFDCQGGWETSIGTVMRIQG